LSLSSPIDDTGLRAHYNATYALYGLNPGSLPSVPSANSAGVRRVDSEADESIGEGVAGAQRHITKQPLRPFLQLQHRRINSANLAGLRANRSA
jgi:hypothetical protein